MTDERKAALKYLDWLATEFGPGGTVGNHAAVLQGMLAEPRLPAEPTNLMLIHMDNAVLGPCQHEKMRDIYRALYVHLTAPKTKTVEVWRVEYAEFIRIEGDEENGYWLPAVKQFRKKSDADAICFITANGPFTSCAHVTGPHAQEVPA